MVGIRSNEKCVVMLNDAVDRHSDIGPMGIELLIWNTEGKIFDSMANTYQSLMLYGSHSRIFLIVRT